MDWFMQGSLPSIKTLSVWTYVISLTLWLTLCLASGIIVIVLNIRDVEKDLNQYGDTFSDHLNKEMVSSDTILKGFSALYGLIGATDPEKVSRYVHQVIDTNPHIFALEIVQVIGKQDLESFVARKRSHDTPNFSVKSFSYDSDRKWQALEEKDFYYPLIFMEPMRAGSEDVLGLDMESIPFLKQAVTDSLQRRTSVASHPFKLVEGILAYVVFCPLSQTFHRDDSPFALNTPDQLVVDMVIDAAKLVQPVKFPVFKGGEVIIYHKDFQPEDENGQLLKMSGDARSAMEFAIFPAFVYNKPLATLGEPFSVMVTRQVGWSDLSLGLLALMAFLSALSSLFIVAYLRQYQQSRILQIKNQNRLWQLANYDTLTGLPNRMLLLDRLNQLLSRALRQGTSLAVIFSDIDDFKTINDTYGHDAGDELLRFVAERLRTAIRTEDTVARLSGDEFIILVENIESRDGVKAVSQKIQQQLADGLLIDGKLISVRMSFGAALFPDDGGNPEILIKKADIAMYADKKSKTVRRLRSV
jgi:diguanylate cyclase (GGDEF)-like protein